MVNNKSTILYGYPQLILIHQLILKSWGQWIHWHLKYIDAETNTYLITEQVVWLVQRYSVKSQWKEHKLLTHCVAFSGCETFLLPVYLFSLTGTYRIPARVLNMLEKSKAWYLSGFPHQNLHRGVFPEHMIGVWMLGSH